MPAKAPLGPPWVIGWREWLALPDLDVPAIKAKIDTGARTSALHAFDVERFRRRGADWVRFQVHPIQRNDRDIVEAEARMIDERLVKDSGGRTERRPVIETIAKMLEREWLIEMTLTNRDSMGFRMLLGRQAVRDAFLIDPHRSFLTGRPRKRTKHT